MLSPPLSLAFLPFFPPFLSFKYYFQDYFGEGVTARKSKRKKTTFPAASELKRPRKGARLWRIAVAIPRPPPRCRGSATGAGGTGWPEGERGDVDCKDRKISAPFPPFWQ